MIYSKTKVFFFPHMYIYSIYIMVYIYGLNHEIKSTCILLYELRVGACPLLMVYTNTAITYHLGDSSGPD